MFVSFASCDNQLQEKMQRRIRTVVRHVQEMHEYKETLLALLAHSQLAQVRLSNCFLH